MLNPFRNKNVLPTYLVTDPQKAGLLSGYMITQYTANALAQKICQLALPVSMFNITSANESEDVVSYGATAAQNLLEQLELLHQLNTVYLTVAAQSYAITRQTLIASGTQPAETLLVERLFAAVLKFSEGDKLPYENDDSFEVRYQCMSNLLKSGELSQIMGAPLRQRPLTVNR